MSEEAADFSSRRRSPRWGRSPRPGEALRRGARRREGLRQDRRARFTARKVDVLVIGGAMANTFSRRGQTFGKSLDRGGLARPRTNDPGKGAGAEGRGCPSGRRRRRAKHGGRRGRGRGRGGSPREPHGPRHRAEDDRAFRAHARRAKSVFWNGPMGLFEKRPFSKGTFAIAHRLPLPTRSPSSAAATARQR